MKQHGLGSQIMLIVSLGLISGAYFVIRYAGAWSEHDTAVFVRIASELVQEGTLDSPGAYSHGYAYPVWVATLSHLSGISVAAALRLTGPLIGNLFLAVFGFATFRRLLGSTRLGLLAASVLFLIPELVFTVSRGNHEKLTVSMTLMLLLATVNTFRHQARGNWRHYVAWVVVLYMTAFTLVSLNIFFGSSAIAASTAVLPGVFALNALSARRAPWLGLIRTRMTVVVSIYWLFFFLMLWYVYPHSSVHDRLITSTAERVTELISPPEVEGVEPSFIASDPYTVGSTDWSSLIVYRVLSSFRWLLFAGSFASWLILLLMGWRRLGSLSLGRFFLLAFYGAFGLLLALAVPIDFLNLSAGTNLQVRIYTYFSLLAAPLLALAVERTNSAIRQRAVRVAALLVTVTVFSAFFGLSMLKATLDPAVSNRWIFYRESAVQAMHFWATRAWREDYGQPDPLWIDPEGRLSYAYRTMHPEAPPRTDAFRVGSFEGTAHALKTPVIVQSTTAWRVETPPHWVQDLVYDNGDAQIWHRTPRTPFQY